MTLYTIRGSEAHEDALDACLDHGGVMLLEGGAIEVLYVSDWSEAEGWFRWTVRAYTLILGGDWSPGVS